jgi:DNA-binding MarR family transcriptional regulator
MNSNDEQATEPNRVHHGRRIHELCGGIARLTAKKHQSKLMGLGLSTGSYSLIRAVGSRDDMTLSDVSKVLSVETATLSSLAVRMERDGLLQREPSPHDKRAMFLKLTERAIELRVQADQVIALEMADVTHRLSDAEQLQLVGLLQRVIGNIKDIAR